MIPSQSSHKLTADEIADFPPGAWLDLQVARALDLPIGRPYSTDIAFAWQAVKAAESLFASTGLLHDGREREKGKFFINGPYLMYGWAAGWLERDSEYPLCEAFGNTAELAICRAVLLGKTLTQ